MTDTSGGAKDTDGDCSRNCRWLVEHRCRLTDTFSYFQQCHQLDHSCKKLTMGNCPSHGMVMEILPMGHWMMKINMASKTLTGEINGREFFQNLLKMQILQLVEEELIL